MVWDDFFISPSYLLARRVLSFLIDSLGFSMLIIMHLQIVTVVFLPVCSVYFLFPFIALARICSTILKKRVRTDILAS